MALILPPTLGNPAWEPITANVPRSSRAQGRRAIGPVARRCRGARARSPGLYAIHGEADAWRELGLGEPPDARPLYIGKAEDILASRGTGEGVGEAGRNRLAGIRAGIPRRRVLAAVSDAGGGTRTRTPQGGYLILKSPLLVSVSLGRSEVFLLTRLIRPSPVDCDGLSAPLGGSRCRLLMPPLGDSRRVGAECLERAKVTLSRRSSCLRLRRGQRERQGEDREQARRRGDRLVTRPARGESLWRLRRDGTR